MLIPKKNRVTILSYLLKEGVLVAKKDKINKHQVLEVPNLHVIKLLQSLKSKGYVHEIFSWQHHFYSLTNEGIEYLREYLHVPAHIVPATLQKPKAQQPRPSFRRLEGESSGRGRGRGRGGRDEYRGPKKTDGAPDNFDPEFSGRRGGRGGYRGRGGFRGSDADAGGAETGGAEVEESGAGDTGSGFRGRGGFRGGRGGFRGGRGGFRGSHGSSQQV